MKFLPLRSPRRYRVALAGYYGFGNFGDELLLRASLEALERCGVPRERVIVLSNDPEATSRDFSVPATSRRSFSDMRRALSSSDTLLLGGGGLFQDSTSLRSCVWYYGLVRLARLCDARPWALGQSIGPLKTRLARRLTRSALGSCSVLHLRDDPSIQWAGRLGLNQAVLGMDLALTLAPSVAPSLSGSSQRTLLLNLRPHRETQRFLSSAMPFVNAFKGEIIGVALAPEDAALLENLGDLYPYLEKIKFSRIACIEKLRDAAEIWKNAACAVGMRLHFAVISALYSTPTLILPYDPKVRAFAQQVGMPCLDPEIKTGPEIEINRSAPDIKIDLKAETEKIARLCAKMMNRAGGEDDTWQ